MSYNKYNTRHSGRFNTPGQFVSAGELGGGAAPGGQRQHNNPNLAVGQPFNQQQQQQQQFQSAQPPLPPPPAPPRSLVPPPQPQPQNTPLQTQDVEMKQEPGTGGSEAGSEGRPRPHWVKLNGVKKISNKERRRRQNENLRRLLTPKNALMVLNEMMPNEQFASQFKVEPASNQFYKANSAQSFCADLTLDGNIYKGFGENKLSARNAAAEKAIRDLIIKRMSKVLTSEVKDGSESDSASQNGEAEGALPMIQLASFALHKLFSEWEYEGVKVPQLKQHAHPKDQPAGSEGECSEPMAVGAPRPKPPLKRKELPPNAASLHPAMLLSYMRPGLEYRELAVEGDKPQTMLFTMGVDVDGATYIGKASNKKEARRAAARAACAALFNLHFPDTPAAAAAPAAANNQPQPMAQ
ncbi:double-stranded RNA-specific editase 1-like isoform X2 [Choristoneura fumiferana]|uniref:double-stranded RNA-specific editase 1-like isoform X2 n=1 Tax=Choristoneura fumiferana TaxID=7141 RepID=UPI003D15D3B2